MTESTPPTIFISHSAKSPAHEHRLMQFAERLSDSGLDPWVDRTRLEVGDAWNPAITTALRDCHGAVVLFSRQALESDFVKYEVSCLTYRKRTQSGFALFPLILDDTPIQTILDGFFGAIQFGDYQIGPIDAKADEVVGKLKALVPTLCRPNLAIERKLLTLFHSVDIDDMRDAAAEIGWETLSNVPLEEAEKLHFVRQLLAAPLPDQINWLCSIKDADAIREKHSLHEIFTMIAPFWVDEKAARMLHSVAFREPSRRGAVINATRGNFTFDMFLRRARPVHAPDRLARDPASGEPGSLTSSAAGVHSAAGRQATADLVEQLRQTLCFHYHVPMDGEKAEIDQAIDSEMAIDESVGVRPFEALQLSELDLPVLKSLLDTFKRMTLVAMTGETVPDIPADLADRVQVIEPKLQHDKTRQWHDEQLAYQYCDPLRLKRWGIERE